ncbi:lytic transglycosylase domain-containing protein [Rhizorhapis sp. SPR117]|nr:lytic transglycosylase domain-containing protein [Sphingobium sp. TKS]MCF8709129.1 lytic transglycosylase domain-containing protein [Rhizorhapis sp. SPR117]
MLCDLSAAVASPSTRSMNEREVARCIQKAAEGRLWLERTLWGLRDQEGGWVGAEVRNTNGSHDLGPLQVNSWWVSKIAATTGRPAAHVRWWLTHDACFNVSAARWIFLSGLAATRDYWSAVGVYHSPTEWRQRRYAASVSQHLKQRFGEHVFAVASVSPVPR